RSGYAMAEPLAQRVRGDDEDASTRTHKLAGAGEKIAPDEDRIFDRLLDCDERVQVVAHAERSEASSARSAGYRPWAPSWQPEPKILRCAQDETTRIPNSSSCFGSTGDGAPAIRSCARAVLGKAITSRSDSARAMTIQMRSNPRAMPPCGGAP